MENTQRETMDEVNGILIIIGDLNGRIGKQEESNDIIGMHGESQRNNNGLRLIHFCILN